MSKHTNEACNFYESFFSFPFTKQTLFYNRLEDWFHTAADAFFFSLSSFQKEVLFDQEIGASLTPLAE